MTDTLATYLQEIGKIPLLKAEEEISHARKICKMIKLTRKKQELGIQENSELARATNQTIEEVEKIFTEGKFSRKIMLESNLRLVVSVAKKYNNNINLELKDLIQEGSLGLNRAIDKFDPTKGYKFSTYAYWWIRQMIIRVISQQERTIRLPVHVVQRIQKIHRSQKDLRTKLHRSPNYQEISEDTGLTIEQIQECLQLKKRNFSLDILVGSDKDTHISELLPSEETFPMENLEKHFLQRDLASIINCLDRQEKMVVTLHYGLNNEEPLTLEKIGKKLKISRERTRVIENQAFRKIRYLAQKTNLSEYLA